jgi:hypothetical protein
VPYGGGGELVPRDGGAGLSYFDDETDIGPDLSKLAHWLRPNWIRLVTITGMPPRQLCIGDVQAGVLLPSATGPAILALAVTG